MDGLLGQSTYAKYYSYFFFFFTITLVNLLDRKHLVYAASDTTYHLKYKLS